MDKPIIYTKAQFEQLVFALKESQKLNTVPIYENVIEFRHGDIPIMMLMHQKGSILISFHITMNAVSAIQMHNSIAIEYKGLMLTESYYVDQDEVTQYGQDAQIAWELELEDAIIGDNKDPEYEPIVPVTYVSKEILYEATHPTVKEVQDEQKKDKKKVWGIDK